MRVGLALALGAALTVSSVLAGPAVGPGDRSYHHGDKLVIAHRGASGYLPEHTLEAYSLAFALGADYIEPDLVMTRDGVLIALHDIHLERTTDVEEVFPARARGDGRWYAADFTLEEIKRLTVHERTDGSGNAVFPERYDPSASGFRVPTFQEVADLVANLNRQTGCEVGLYPETKAPAFHDAEGLPMEKTLLRVLADNGYSGRDANVFVQSFNPANLKEMRWTLGTNLPLVQLIGGGERYDSMVTPEGLDEVATYADGIGPSKRRIEAADGTPVDGGALVRLAHERGLVVHPYTFRADQLTAGDPRLAHELRRFYYRYSVDGVFTDFPDIGALVAHRSRSAGARLRHSCSD